MALLPSDPQKQKLVLLGLLLIGGLAYGGYAYVYEPRREQITAMEERLERLELINRGAMARTQGGGVAEAERQLAFYEAQLQAMEGLVPTSEEMPDLLDAIAAEARRNGVEMALIQPVGATKEEYYTRRTYELAVVGTYHDIGGFLTRVASLERIITPINLSLVPRENPLRPEQAYLEAKFAIETFVLPGPGDEASPMPSTVNRQRGG